MQLFRPKKFELSPRLKFSVGRGYSQNQVLKYAALACLVVTAGLSVNALRLWFTESDTWSEGKPEVLGATDQQPSEEQAPFEFEEYRVQKGDTLFNVSQRFSINWATLATLNNLQSPFTLKVGQVLKVPKN